MSIMETIYKKFSAHEDLLKNEQFIALTMEDMNLEIEDLLCFERAMRFCYASLNMLSHNRTIRQQYEIFLQGSFLYEEDLKKILADGLSSDNKFEKRYDDYALPSTDLTLHSVLNLAVVVAEHRRNLYQELRNHVSMKNRILLNHIIGCVDEEVKFLHKETEIGSVESILQSVH